MNHLLYLAGVIFLAVGAASPEANAKNGQFVSGADAAKVLYYGGPVISNVKVYTVLWGSGVNSSIAAAMPEFYGSLVNSTYMDSLPIEGPKQG